MASESEGHLLLMGGGPGVVLGTLAEAGADGIVVDVVTVLCVIPFVANAVVGEAFLPNGVGDLEAVGEAALEEHHGAFEGDVLWSEEEVDVVGHGDEGVEFVEAFVTVVLEGLEEELGVGFDLEEAAAVVGLGADEEGAVAGEAGGLAHGWAKRTSAAKAVPWHRRGVAWLKPWPFRGGCGFGWGGLREAGGVWGLGRSPLLVRGWGTLVGQITCGAGEVSPCWAVARPSLKGHGFSRAGSCPFLVGAFRRWGEFVGWGLWQEAGCQADLSG